MLIFLLLIGLNTSQLADQDPVLDVLADGSVRLGLPASILENKEVHHHLSSGLTVTFQVQVAFQTEFNGPGQRVVQVDVRYEPWEEVYLVTAQDLVQGSQTYQFKSFAEFVLWWRGVHLTLSELEQGDRITSRARVVVKVIPFSQAEQHVAQKWFTKSLRAAETNDATETQRGSSSFDLFLATSIKRKPMMRFQWKVDPR